VKKQKYQKYVDSPIHWGFTSIDVNHQEGLQCVLCLKIWLQKACFQAK
jgi:hypothetical protein